MKFSIVIPTLNEEKYVGNILRCLENQTYKEFEVIVVDGDSEDSTRKEVLKHEVSLSLKFLDSPKRGVSFQRNFGAKHAKNEYLIFFDADVMIDPDFIEKIKNYIENNNVDVLTSWNDPVSDRKIDAFLFFIVNTLMLEAIKKKSPGAIGVFICVRKGVFDSVEGFRENISFGEDYDLVKRIHEKGFIYALLKDPKIKVSVRRLDKEGRFKMVIKQIKGSFYYLLGGDDYIDKLQGKIKHEFGKFN